MLQHEGPDDLISIGTIGLIKAEATFDYGKGTRFATYASHCIENEILTYFRNHKKSAQDVYISDPIDTDKDGNALAFQAITTDVPASLATSSASCGPSWSAVKNH